MQNLNNSIILSIVIPVYNVAHYLPTCLESVLTQMQAGVEIILVDDGSEDASPQILRDYQQRYDFLQIITHSGNQSLGSARNSGFKMAQGEWIYFLDSDDFIAPNTLRPILETLTSEQPDILIFPVSPYDDLSQKVVTKDKNFRIFPQNKPAFVLYDNFQQRLFQKPFKHMLTIGNYPFTGNKIFRRHLVKKFPFPEKIYYEDLPFYIHALLHSNSQIRLQKTAQELRLFYRINRQNSITAWENYNPQKGQDIIKILDQCTQMLQENMPKLNAYFLVTRIWTAYFHIRDTRANRAVYAKQFLRSIYQHFQLLALTQKIYFPFLFAYHFAYKTRNFSGNFRYLKRLFRKS